MFYDLFGLIVLMGLLSLVLFLILGSAGLLWLAGSKYMEGLWEGKLSRLLKERLQ